MWLARNAAVLTVVGGVVAQAASRPTTVPVLRQAVRGEVLTAGGKPRAGAKVTLFSRRMALFGTPWAPIDTDWGQDRVETISDDAGRFAAQLLTDQEYAAWAVSDAGQGLLRITPAVSPVFAGAVMALREPEEPSAPVRLEVTGRAAWQEHSPLVLHVLSRTTPTWSADLELTGDVVVLPVAPWRHLDVDLRPRGGAPVWFRSIDRSVPSAVRIELPPPTRLPVRIVRAPDDKPVAGATVSTAVLGILTPVATTDADGRCQVPIAGKAARFGNGNIQHLHVSAPGLAATLWCASERYSGPDPLGEDGLTLRLFPGGSLRGRVTPPPGAAPERLPLVWMAMVLRGPEGQPVGCEPFLTWTQTDGAFVVPGMAPGREIELWAGLPGRWARAQVLDGVPTQAAAPIASLKTKASGDTDLGVIELARLGAVEAAGTLPDGAPAEHAVVGLRMPGWRFAQPTGYSDRFGRARWLVPPEGEVVVGGLLDGSFGAASVRAARPPIRIAFAALPVVAGRLVDDVLGAPLPGVEFGLGQFSTVVPGPEARLGTDLFCAWVRDRPRATGSDGRFTTFVPLGAGDCRLQFRRRVEGRQRIHDAQVQPGDTDLEIVFR